MASRDLWAAASAMFVVAGLGLRHIDSRLAAALAVWGLFSAAITLDDRFLLHEVVLPHFGIPEAVSYLTYAVANLVLLVVFRSVLLEQPERWCCSSA